MPHTYRKVRLDALLWALGGFAEPEHKPIDVRHEMLARLWRNGRSVKDIAELLGITEDNVRAWRHILRLPPRFNRRKADAVAADDRRLTELWRKGLPASVIAARLGMTRNYPFAKGRARCSVATRDRLANQ